MAAEAVAPEPEVVVEEMPPEAPVAEPVAVEAAVVAEVAAVPVPARSEIAVKLAMIPPVAAMEAPVITHLSKLHPGSTGDGRVSTVLRLDGGRGKSERRERRRAC